MIKIILLGTPLSTNGIYKFASKPFPRTYMTAAGKEIKKGYISSIYEQFKMNPLSCPIEIKIELFFGDLRKRDWDNYNKIIMDSFNGIVWEDDSQIIKGTVIKNYSKENPRIEIEIDEYKKDLTSEI